MAHVCVIVLGDLGRSPRMQYHANSLSHLSEVKSVTLIGYSGEKCIEAVVNNTKIHQKRMEIPAFAIFRKISILHAGLRALAMIAVIMKQLVLIGSYDVILIQNPPCLPVVMVAALMKFINGSRIIIDWHNLGFKMFEERHGPTHLLVRLSKAFERAVARVSDENVCVSRALSDWLSKEFHIPVGVVYDKPATIFSRQRPAIEIIHKLFLKLGFTDDALFGSICSKRAQKSENSVSTIQTSQDSDGNLTWRSNDFCPLIISSTSWTPDEDFNLFLYALLMLNTVLQSLNQKELVAVPYRVLVAITGKGPQRSEFESKIRSLESDGKLQYVRIRTVWLEPEEYPLLMGCANLGVCLHTSTSGLDLPMKVLDMFGSGVAVCAANFPALSELVRDNENGQVFSTEKQLFEQIYSLLFTNITRPSPQSHLADGKGSNFNWSWESNKLRQLRINAAKIETWETNWSQNMAPVVTRALGNRSQFCAPWVAVGFIVVLIACVYCLAM